VRYRHSSIQNQARSLCLSLLASVVIHCPANAAENLSFRFSADDGYRTGKISGQPKNADYKWLGENGVKVDLDEGAAVWNITGPYSRANQLVIEFPIALNDPSIRELRIEAEVELSSIIISSGKSCGIFSLALQTGEEAYSPGDSVVSTLVMSQSAPTIVQEFRMANREKLPGDSQMLDGDGIDPAGKTTYQLVLVVDNGNGGKPMVRAEVAVKGTSNPIVKTEPKPLPANLSEKTVYPAVYFAWSQEILEAIVKIRSLSISFK